MIDPITTRTMKLRGIILGIGLVALGLNAQAISGGGKNKSANNNTKASAAECAPASGLDYLKYNAVNALIETGGSMWQNRPNHAAAYEVPKGSGSTSIYSGSLWMGGTDANDQLKIAAVTFRTGTNDFWTGPLTTDGAAEITPDVCTEYDQFFHITRADVDLFIAYWNCKTEGIGCDVIPEGYSIPKIILNWPAHGDEGLGQDFYLAPFYDRDGDGIYDPENSGDYPYYDVKGDIDCRAVRDIRLFGDDTFWWVFNDKGNIHTETNGQSIGMEIRAQAFAFSTNDEVNNMTFYNYELINRSTFTLFNTYFGQWVDPDLGCSNDDYVGCDVGRGLGYCYNGDDFDEDCNGALGYGNNPPAVGIDFFEGPYQDNDGINNLVGIGPNEALNGIGYKDESLPSKLQDSIIDNERYGMRRFIYYNRGGGIRGDAQTALDHYNYLRSIWRDGNKMVYGGNGYPGDPGATSLKADFMFPDGSDPLHWGTQGIDPGGPWTEITAGNPPFDRRFLESAGPFTLEPGAVNDITVGVVWARAISGDAFESVNSLFVADTKAQALFDNCFKVLSGPDAPDLGGIELNREIILYLTNKKGISNNFKKYPGDYLEADPFIVAPEGKIYDNKYRFQGYMIYQVSGDDVKANELDNLDRARLAFQCDIKDSVVDIVNYTFDEEIGATVPAIMVKDAANNGIVTTFRATEDLFATGDPKLVNFKTYYYLAIAYGYNNYKTYKETPEGLDGQKKPFLASRKSAIGGIENYGFTPHPQQPTNGGTVLRAEYGDQPQITRIEGQGNGGNNLAFTPSTLQRLLDASSATEVFPTYRRGRGPLGVKVVDPRNVVDGQFTLKVYTDENGDNKWKAWRVGSGSAELNDTVYSDGPIEIDNEQIITQWGVSINFKDVPDPGKLLADNLGQDPAYKVGIIGASITYVDSAQRWLSGVPDVTGADDQNWIRSGVAADEQQPASLYNSYFTTVPDPKGGPDISVPIDAFGYYEKLLGGTWGPHRLCSYTRDFNGTVVRNAPGIEFQQGGSVQGGRLEDLQSVDIVITNNKDKWTRCPVVEMQEEKELAVGGAGLSRSLKGQVRQSPSVDKDGQPDGDGMGMGWFPGYAINLETGERLNMAFGEDSWLGDQNGADMIWNPTSVLEEGYGDNYRKWGGKHYIYVFGVTKNMTNKRFDMPAYDEGATLRNAIQPTSKESDLVGAWSTCLWVGIPLLAENQKLMATDVTVSLRVDKKYEVFKADTIANNGRPMYTWNTMDLSTEKGVTSVAEDALNMIRVVPNPYYAFAEHYEQAQLDNIVKITNLPERCEVSIYNVSGTLVRKYDKSDPTTEIRWDLKNQSNVPIASGLYLIHVNAPGVGEKIVKWYGILRPVDLQGF